MALVFQSYALWPHMNVRQNIGYGLKVRRQPRAAIHAKVDEILNLLGLDGFAERPVTALSGGQRQRVALGRALAVEPADSAPRRASPISTRGSGSRCAMKSGLCRNASASRPSM